MRIHLIRHGQTDWNKEKRVQGHSESSLSSEGRSQARALAPALAEYGISHVYCSPSARTRETAALLFETSEVTISFHDELREIFLGPWEGHLQSDIKERYPDAFDAFWHRPHEFSLEGAEQFSNVLMRAHRMLASILAKPAAQEVAIVSHGVWIKALLSDLDARPLARLWDPPVMHNCAHSILSVDSTHARPRILKFAGHLQQG